MRRKLLFNYLYSDVVVVVQNKVVPRGVRALRGIVVLGLFRLKGLANKVINIRKQGYQLIVNILMIFFFFLLSFIYEFNMSLIIQGINSQIT